MDGSPYSSTALEAAVHADSVQHLEHISTHVGYVTTIGEGRHVGFMKNQQIPSAMI